MSTPKRTNERTPIICVLERNAWDVERGFENQGAIVVNAIDLNEYLQIYDMVDMVVLTGGTDISAKHYGEKPHAQSWWAEHDRDSFELSAARLARDMGVPLFGICRGSQIINVASGGSLHQHIDDLHDDIRGHVGSDHRIRVRRKSPLYNLFGSKPRVNSLHHQAVNRLGHELRVEAWATDGIPEIIMGTGKGEFVLGVQWHPEIMQFEGGRKIAWRLFKYLTNQAAQRSRRHETSTDKRLAAIAEITGERSPIVYTSRGHGWSTDTWDFEKHRDREDLLEWEELNSRGEWEPVIHSDTLPYGMGVDDGHRHEDDDGTGILAALDAQCIDDQCNFAGDCDLGDGYCMRAAMEEFKKESGST